MSDRRLFAVPADLADKLERMAKAEGKSADDLLIEVLNDHVQVTEFLLRKASERAGKRKAATVRSRTRTARPG